MYSEEHRELLYSNHLKFGLYRLDYNIFSLNSTDVPHHVVRTSTYMGSLFQCSKLLKFCSASSLQNSYELFLMLCYWHCY